MMRMVSVQQVSYVSVLASWLGNILALTGVATTAAPSLNGNDGITLVDDAQSESRAKTVLDAVVDIGLPSLISGRSGLIVEEGVAASVQVNLAGRGGVSGDYWSKSQ